MHESFKSNLLYVFEVLKVWLLSYCHTYVSKHLTFSDEVYLLNSSVLIAITILYFFWKFLLSAEEFLRITPIKRYWLMTVLLLQNHCRHCIRVFCASCLSHTVLSGPNNRASKVCDVCHTLLDRDTAPYFSTDPPHSND